MCVRLYLVGIQTACSVTKEMSTDDVPVYDPSRAFKGIMAVENVARAKEVQNARFACQLVCC